MIYEYVIDPALVLKWAETDRDYGEFVQAFGLGSSRLMSRFPKLKHWRRLILRAIPHDMEDCLFSRRVDELVVAISETRVQRDGFNFTFADDWIEATAREHDRTPFDFVFLADEREAEIDCGFKQSDIYTPGAICWKHQRAAITDRNAHDMADTVGNLLRLSNHILLIDPHFSTAPSKLNAIFEYIRKSVSHRVNSEIPIIEVLFNIDSNNRTQASRLFDTIVRGIGEYASSIQLKVKALEQLSGEQELHNRYILTDLGGVQFGHGLDEGDSTDEVFLITREIYERRWREYADCCAFRLFEEYRG